MNKTFQKFFQIGFELVPDSVKVYSLNLIVRLKKVTKGDKKLKEIDVKF